MIEPLDFDELIKDASGKEVWKVARDVLKACVDKVNEIVEQSNK